MTKLIFLPAGARAARERLVLRLLYVFRVCLSVRPHLSRAQYITSYVTMQLQYSSVWRFAGQVQQMKVVLCCLDGENVVDSREDPGSWHIATNWRRMTKLLSQHFRCTALGI